MTPSNPPGILYGTAWKEERTRELTCLALRAGFRGIDTANQRKHYFEEAVGLGLEDYRRQVETDSRIFLQTKFTYLRGQDHRLPYEKDATLTKQVEQSLESSLKHLKTDFIDSYVLHGPSHHLHLTDDDFEVWSAMESHVRSGRIGALGVSNINISQLKELTSAAEIKPRYVQNRCFAVTGWDFEVREWCRSQEITYQGFSLLTANLDFLRAKEVATIASTHRATIPQIVFAFSRQLGMLPITGTTSEEHMKQDLASELISLTSTELQLIEKIALT